MYAATSYLTEDDEFDCRIMNFETARHTYVQEEDDDDGILVCFHCGWVDERRTNTLASVLPLSTVASQSLLSCLEIGLPTLYGFQQCF